MAKQSLGIRTSDGTIAKATAELIAGANDITVTEISIYINAATQSVFGIGFPAAIGVTPTTPVALQLHDGRDPAAVAMVAVAWGTGPTVPAQFFYRVQLTATVGAGLTISIPEGIVVKNGTSLVIWNISATSVADINFVVSTKQVGQIRYAA